MPQRITHAERKARRKLIAEMAEAGMTWKEISEKMGVGYASIRLACLEHGIAPPAKDVSRRCYTSVSSFAILKMLLDGKTARETFIKFGISKQRVHQIKQKAKDAGFTFTTTGESQ